MESLKRALKILLAATLTACNSGVFIEDFLPETQEVILRGGTSSLHFKAENWGIFGLVKNNPASSEPVSLSVFDSNGKKASLPIQEKEGATISVGTGTISFKIEKKESKRLDFVNGENMEEDTVRYILEIGNEYERKHISILLPPTRKYKIDSVVYQWDKFSYSDDIVEASGRPRLIVNNSAGKEPASVFLQPYKDAFRKVKFHLGAEWNDTRIEKFFGKEETAILIPDIVDGKAELSGTKAFLRESEQKQDAGLDRDLEIRTSVPAGKRMLLETFLCIQEYHLPFTVHASNSQTGRKITLPGDLSSKKPFKYLILKKEMKDDEK